ncbi:DUF1289 domain-containing protein [Rhodanobacter sp. DHG33]|nr:DUF1289 domain-containing protein [Rhodanobacter sp. DHG33]
MSNELPSAPPSPATPCIGVCQLDAQGYCIGCRRTIEEIGRWRSMSDAERLRVMREVLPARGQP